ncbi:hypothetical protein [Sphingomonas elodea]|uniref:hypothetical protein n=1 Tax=Sphingomonas elodea TaxID=179878 RepID=UPI000263212C|nr:hypothetical protein [Sphingomonas elodea]
MLIALTLFASLQDTLASATPVNPAAQEEIVVIGRKLRDWRGKLDLSARGTRCLTKRSTGDREVDQIGCDAMMICVPKFEAELKAALNQSKDKASRERANADVSRRITLCFQTEHDRRSAALAERRVALRRR